MEANVKSLFSPPQEFLVHWKARSHVTPKNTLSHMFFATGNLTCPLQNKLMPTQYARNVQGYKKNQSTWEPVENFGGAVETRFRLIV